MDRKVQTILPFSKYSCSLVNLKYKILDVFSLKRHFGAKSTQNSVEGQITNEFRKLLAREEEDPAVTKFREYIRIETVQPNPDNAGAMKFLASYAEDLETDVQEGVSVEEAADPQSLRTRLHLGASLAAWGR